MTVKRSKNLKDPWAVSLNLVLTSHPLNVKPLGNYLLATKNDNRRKLTKEAQMGHFCSFDDELMMHFLSFIDDINSLRNLSHTSRVLYAYLFDEDLWKRLYISLDDNDPKLKESFIWRGSWRSSLLNIDESQQAKLQLPDNLLFSDVLYRPFQCSQVDYNRAFARIIQEEAEHHKKAKSITGVNEHLSYMESLPRGRILRYPEAFLSAEDFYSKLHDKPFILTSEDMRWPKWNLQELGRRFPDVKFRQEAVSWSLALYLKYLRHNQDESPLYLFDCASDAMKTLKKEYEAPEIFQTDLFKVFEGREATCRPDFAWIIIGPQRSGSTFHKDPNYTSAWNTAIQGRKLWIMLPPHISPAGVATDKDESEVTSPVGIAEWVIAGFFNDCLQIEGCLIGITFPGECMYVPAGWWHSVINLDDSIALTQNFVPPPKLKDTLSFFKNKPDQVSGFRLKEVMEAIEVLLRKAKTRESDLVLLESFLNKCKSIKLDNGLETEDLGELCLSELPLIPIYELFKQLLLENGFEKELEGAIASLKEEEKRILEKQAKNKAWSTLVIQQNAEDSVESKASGFSFGFDFEDE